MALKIVHKRRAWHEARRAEALERQRMHRQVSVDHARRLGDSGLTVANAPEVYIARPLCLLHDPKQPTAVRLGPLHAG